MLCVSPMMYIFGWIITIYASETSRCNKTNKHACVLFATVVQSCPHCWTVVLCVYAMHCSFFCSSKTFPVFTWIGMLHLFFTVGRIKSIHVRICVSYPTQLVPTLINYIYKSQIPTTDDHYFWITKKRMNLKSNKVVLLTLYMCKKTGFNEIPK